MCSVVFQMKYRIVMIFSRIAGRSEIDLRCAMLFSGDAYSIDISFWPLQIKFYVWTEQDGKVRLGHGNATSPLR